MVVGLALTTTFSRLSTIQFFTLAVTASHMCLIDVHVMGMYLMSVYLIGVCLWSVFRVMKSCRKVVEKAAQRPRYCRGQSSSSASRTVPELSIYS
jgi:hypothetical protein